MKLFGSSGIRGIANKEITPELALNVGLVLGSRKKTAVIGRDPRVSAPMIEHALIAGLTASGCDVTEVGLVTTPTLAYAAREYECGVMVTASHNPSEYVGIKLWNPDGMAFDSAQQDEIEKAIEDRELFQGSLEPDRQIRRRRKCHSGPYEYDQKARRKFQSENSTGLRMRGRRDDQPLSPPGTGL